ncbi:hypothetical protein [Streptomyces regalis]|uniref:Peptidase M48 domain-containing protein n=1 Tax=Streptomyces regalis TaxID=68262 RepID=A0A0X3VPE5_9ACTN|nr:hypothetical protein [Streptomyces regalis]KUL46182.1 hypothetical protein ADL12_02695 [Streptomyces regalis]
MNIRPPALRAWLLTIGMAALAWLPSAVMVLALMLVSVAWDGSRWVAIVPPALIIAGLVRGALERGRLPGRALRPGDEPELAALVRDVAERIGFQEPLLVRIVPEVQASLGPTKVAGVRAYALLLGLPLLRGLSEAQLASVVAHELAHEQQVSDRRTAALRFARHTLTDRLESRRFRPLSRPATALLRASQPMMWHAELAADADAAGAVGTTATAEALRRTGVLHEAFEGLGATWWSALMEDGTYPEDFYDALDTALHDPLVVRRATRAAEEEDTLDPYTAEDHPPVADRIAALPTGVEPSTAYGTEPLVLRTGDLVEGWCVAELAGVEAGAKGTTDTGSEGARHGDPYDDPRPVRLLTMAPDRLHDLGDDTGLTLLLAATGRQEPERAVAVALDAVADGSWPRLARRLEPDLRWMPAAVRPSIGRTVLASAVAPALTTVLRAAGWSYASRWLNSALTAPDGTVVDLHELVGDAVAAGDPGPVRAVLASTKTREAAA